jgi:hypothetical protein
MKDIIAEIFKGIDEKLVSEEVKAKVAEMINKVVDARVAAKTAETDAASVKLQEEKAKLASELDQIKKDIADKEAFLKEAAADFGKQLAEEFKQKEDILFETLKEYQEESIKVLQETAKDYRDKIEEEALVAANEYKTFVESSALESAAEFKRMRQEADAKSLETFKSDLIEKANEYMQSQLKTVVPEQIMEAAAKAAALEPLVESMVSVIEKHGISVDKSGFDALKAAKAEITKLSESVNAKTQENVKLGSRVKELEKAVKLKQLTEGMTQAQKSKAEKLLESCSVEELETRFKVIKDIVISESAKPAKVSVKDVKTQVVVDTTKKQVDRIVETIQKPVGGQSSEMDTWATQLSRMRRN